MKNRFTFYFVLNFINTFLCGTNFFNLKRKLLNFIGIKIGNNTKIVGPIIIGRAANLTIGNNVWVGKNFEVYGNGDVTIGDNIDFGPSVKFFTGSHQIGSNKRRAGIGIAYSYTIEDGSWIGGHSKFINGANLKKGCVVGAASLVTKSFDEDLLIVGSPAKAIKKL